VPFAQSLELVTVGAGPGTEKKKGMKHNFPFGYSDWEFWTTPQGVPFLLEIFPSGKLK